MLGPSVCRECSLASSVRVHLLVVNKLALKKNLLLQGVPYLSLPKKEKPRRVELYFSSWRIRAGNFFLTIIIMRP
jgi:hypothetical protein